VEGEFSRQRLLSGFDLTVVVVLELDGRDIADAAVEPAGVEPADPVQGSELEVVDAVPGSFRLSAFGLVEAEERERFTVRLGSGAWARRSQACREGVEVVSIGRRRCRRCGP
jgi:hypothetical protein